MKYPTKKTHKNKHRNKKQYRGGSPNSKRKRVNNNNNQNNNNGPKVKKLKLNNNIQKIGLLETQYVDFESKENASEFRQGLRLTEPPHTMMFNNNIEPVFIGKGVNGCAFKPPIKCSPSFDNDPLLKDHILKISKLMDIHHAKKEMKIYSNLGLNEIKEASKYFIVNPYQCPPDENFKIDKTKCPVKIDTPSLLIYENGGIDLYQYLKNNNHMRGQAKDADFLFILKCLLNIFEGVRVLNEKRIFHFDIKEDNIVLGKENKDYKLIDFGNAKMMPFFFNTVKLDHIIRQNNSNMNTNLETQLTQAFTPSRPSASATPSRDQASATPSRSSASATPSKSKTVKMSIRVEDPVIFRILPVYQFFITQPFKNNKPSREDYELLSNKFIETFMTIDDNIIEKKIIATAV